MYLPLCLVFLATSVNSAKILGLFTAPSLSHQVTFQPIWKELSLRGHQVTVVATHPLKDKSLTNLTEIDIGEVSKAIWAKHNISSFGVKTEVDSTDLSRFISCFMEMMDAQLSNEEVKKLIRNEAKEHFDVVLVEFSAIHLYQFKNIYNAPIVGISSMPLGVFGNEFMGNPNHPVLYPDFNLAFSRNLTFTERLTSTFYSTIGIRLLKRLMPNITGIAQKHYGEDVGDLEKLAFNLDLALFSSNPVLQPVRPNVPAAIEFTGIHIKPPKPLPKDLKAMMDKASQGIVYVSFGSNIKSSEMPEEKIEVFLQAFKELPYKVLWKFEAGNLPNKPDNVEVRKWLPQQDVLRHSNVKLFITQGGLQSLDEAMYTKTPVLVMPFFADQFGNARKVVDIGMGKSIKFANLNKDELKDAILEIASSKRYHDRIQELHDIVIDQPMTALDKCIYWIEYVIRHKGAYHLRSPLLDIPTYQYYLLDVIGFVIFVLSSIVFAVYLVVRKIRSWFVPKLKQL